MAQPPVAFNPPKTVPVFRVQKDAWRQYLLSGGAMQVTVNPPPAQLATAATTVTGQLYVDLSLNLYPPTVTVDVLQRAAVKATNTATVTATGAFSTTFPANTLAAGNAATARVSCTLPVATATSSSFNVT
jgi:hypothetical protein